MKRLWALLALVLMLTSLAGPVVAADHSAAPAGAADHWAAPDVSGLVAVLGWTTPPDLDKPITPVAWNGLVALLAGVKPGEVPQQQDERRYWVWVYTGGMAKGQPVIARQHAIGGLMKLTYLLYQEDKFHQDKQALGRFGDAKLLVDYQETLVAGAVGLELVKGDPEGRLRPEQPLTYAEAATLISRVLQRYGKLLPPDPLRPLGFGRGLAQLPFKPEGIISDGTAGSEAGHSRVVVHGAAYASALPGVGVPAPGHVWVLVDVQVTNLSDADLPLRGGLRIALADQFQVLYTYEADVKASAATGSPFTGGSELLPAGRTMRGVVAFAVPVGTPGLWYTVESRAGQSPAKDTWSSSQRGSLGDLIGPERVFPHGAGPRDGIAKLVGVYERAADAAVLTAALRRDGMPAWIEAEPDGRYAAIVGVKAR